MYPPPQVLGLLVTHQAADKAASERRQVLCAARCPALLSVATLNLHWGRGADGLRFDIVAACASLDADVVALQEQTGPPGGPSAAATIAAELGYRRYETTLSDRIDDSAGRWIGAPEPSGGTWGLATLTRLPIIQAADVALGQGRRDPEHRAQVATLAVGQTAIRIVNTHLTNRAPASLQQLCRLRQLLAADTDAATVALGDPPVDVIGLHNASTAIHLTGWGGPGWRLRTSTVAGWPLTRIS